MTIAPKVLSRSVVASLLAVPFVMFVFVSTFNPVFPDPADPENYYSHSLAWMFVCAVVIISFANNRLWEADETRRSVLYMRLLLGLCLAAAVLDVVGDVALPAFVLKTRVDNIVAWPLVIAVPLSIIGLVGGFIAARRPRMPSSAS